MDLLRLLRSARWLTTTQVKRRFFPMASADAVRKRLRILTEANYLLKIQPDRCSDALFTLCRNAKPLLERETGTEVVLERRPPRQREHHSAIERRAGCSFVPVANYDYSNFSAQPER
jgi:hypothetical protein